MRISATSLAGLFLGISFISSAHATCTQPSGAYSGAGGASISIAINATPPTTYQVNQEMLIDSFANGGTYIFKSRLPFTQGGSGLNYTATNYNATGTIQINNFNPQRCRGSMTITATAFQVCVAGQPCGPVQTSNLPPPTTLEFVSTDSGNSVKIVNQDPNDAVMVVGNAIELRHP